MHAFRIQLEVLRQRLLIILDRLAVLTMTIEGNTQTEVAHCDIRMYAFRIQFEVLR